MVMLRLFLMVYYCVVLCLQYMFSILDYIDFMLTMLMPLFS